VKRAYLWTLSLFCSCGSRGEEQPLAPAVVASGDAIAWSIDAPGETEPVVLAAGTMLDDVEYRGVTLAPPRGAKGVVVHYGAPHLLDVFETDPAWLKALDANLERVEVAYKQATALHRKYGRERGVAKEAAATELAAALRRLRQILGELHTIPFDAGAALAAADGHHKRRYLPATDVVMTEPVGSLDLKMSQIEILIAYADTPVGAEPVAPSAPSTATLPSRELAGSERFDREVLAYVGEYENWYRELFSQHGEFLRLAGAAIRTPSAQARACERLAAIGASTAAWHRQHARPDPLGAPNAYQLVLLRRARTDNAARALLDRVTTFLLRDRQATRWSKQSGHLADQLHCP